jgi:hypothetical protein
MVFSGGESLAGQLVQVTAVTGYLWGYVGELAEAG